jgi:type IV pilus assembly protein PilX
MNPTITNIKQRGVVLFIALIALLVMSLAAVALIRSVDTNTIIAGNLALKQSALIASDRGSERALNWIADMMNVDDQSLNVNRAAEGYFATFDVNGDGIINDLDDAKTLVDNNGIVETMNDGQGNAVSYVVQRMCMLAAPADDTNVCMYGDAVIGTGSRGVKTAPQAGARIDSKQSPMYRITVRVNGPKNTVSYTQTFVY